MVEFGVYLPQIDVNYDLVKRIALECERYGFDSAWLTDHMLPFSGSLQRPYLECWTTLSALAEATDNLRLGTLVLCNLFRHPAVLAKMVATLDVISGGRLEIGIGAGWVRYEFDAYGIPFPKASVRIAMLREAIEVMKRMWTEDMPTFQGEYYRIKGAACNPKPLQKPHPPIWIGTLIGGRLMFETIAKYADGWVIGSLYLPSIEEYKQQLEKLRLQFLKHGRNFEKLRKALGIGCILAENKAKLKEKAAKYKPMKVSVDKYKKTQMIVSVTPDECIKFLEKYVKLGVGLFIMNFPDITTLESMRIFAESVIPHFRK